MKEQDIYKMELHDEIFVHNSLSILRVASGWIYTFDVETVLTATFVPFDNRFQESK